MLYTGPVMPIIAVSAGGLSLLPGLYCLKETAITRKHRHSDASPATVHPSEANCHAPSFSPVTTPLPDGDPAGLGLIVVFSAPAGASPAAGPTMEDSTNWAGYVNFGGGFTFSSATGSWVQPNVSCPPTGLQEVEFAVGIDGYVDDNAQLAGTIAACDLGQLSISTFVQFYPGPLELGGPVLVGDTINATASRGIRCTLGVTDPGNTVGNLSATQNCFGQDDASAEWLATAPDNGTGIYPLARFGTWDLTKATVNGGPISRYPQVELTMATAATPPVLKAVPSPLTTAGNSFTVSWWGY